MGKFKTSLYLCLPDGSHTRSIVDQHLACGRLIVPAGHDIVNLLCKENAQGTGPHGDIEKKLSVSFTPPGTTVKLSKDLEIISNLDAIELEKWISHFRIVTKLCQWDGPTALNVLLSIIPKDLLTELSPLNDIEKIFGAMCVYSNFSREKGGKGRVDWVIQVYIVA
ncbi:hypothetical protein ENBRE01_3348 [Enteropsectra breve]|nr:hypothetical protein ENBRE01_3348 [Enteropsectra breve]